MTRAVIRRAQPWLGTIVSIELAEDDDPARSAHAFTRAFAAIERVHTAMSAQLPTSDVARFNRAREGAVFACDPWTVRVLQLAARLRRASGGLFDVALGTARASAYGMVDPRHVIKLDRKAQIDLGGIAKGYAVDRAVATLRCCGIKRGLVNAGGDLRAFGPGRWPILVRGAGALALERGALATSQYLAGRSPYRNDALITPATGAVREIDRAITVAARNCALADALTKVIALSGTTRHSLLREVQGQAWLR
jgi:FAD:protein FMN transferase